LAHQALGIPLSRSGSFSSNSSSSSSMTPTKRSNPDPIGRTRGQAKRVMLSWAQKAITKYVDRKQSCSVKNKNYFWHSRSRQKYVKIQDN